MNRFKNQILLAAGFAVLAGVISGITAAPAIAAAIKAALIKNVDESGRVPYYKKLSCSSPINICIASAPAVPANMRLVIEHVGAHIQTDIGFRVESFSMQAVNDERALAHADFNTTSGLQDISNVNAAVLAYFEPGEIPSVGVAAPGGRIGMVTVISGYLVDLTI